MPNYGNIDTMNIGMKPVPQQGVNAGDGLGGSVVWDPMWQQMPKYSGNANDAFSNSLTGGAGGGIGGAYGLQQFADSGAAAEKFKQDQWIKSRDALSAIPGQYNALASTQGAQGLTNQLTANPLSLSPAIVQAMKNQTSNQISAQTDNAARAEQGTLAAGGQDDASTLAAMQSQLARQGMGAQQTQNTNIDIAAAKQRPIDLANAAGVAQKQSALDIGVPFESANSIMSHQPTTEGMNPGILAAMISLMGMNNASSIANKNATAYKDPGNTAGGKIGGDSGISGGSATMPGAPGYNPNPVQLLPKGGGTVNNYYGRNPDEE